MLKSKNILLILGMHRSGTSLLATIIEAAGVNLGAENELSPNSIQNIFGFKENTKLQAINKELLYFLNCSWYDPYSINTQNYPDDLKEKARIALKELLHKSDIVGFKDPRTSLVIDFWDSLLNDSVNYKYIYIYRNPLEVAKSLDRRNKIPIESGLKLWEFYNQRIIKFLQGRDYLTVNYSNILEDPISEGERIMRYIGIKPSKTKLMQIKFSTFKEVQHFKKDTINIKEKYPKTYTMWQNLSLNHQDNLKRYPLKKIELVINYEKYSQFLLERLEVIDRKFNEFFLQANTYLEKKDEIINYLQNKLTNYKDALKERDIILNSSSVKKFLKIKQIFLQLIPNKRDKL